MAKHKSKAQGEIQTQHTHTVSVFLVGPNHPRNRILEERDLLGRVPSEERLPRERIEFLCEEIALVELKEGKRPFG